MDLWPLEMFYTFRAGINFRLQILAFKVGPSTERVNSVYITSDACHILNKSYCIKTYMNHRDIARLLLNITLNRSVDFHSHFALGIAIAQNVIENYNY